MSEFISSAEAFRVARERASVAAAFEASMLHLAVFDARESGMSVRQTAVALSVPKSTVARHWREHHQCTLPLPIWGSPLAWREAHEKIWAHNPRELADVWVPFVWSDNGVNRTVGYGVRGVAVLRSDRTSPNSDSATQ